MLQVNKHHITYFFALFLTVIIFNIQALAQNKNKTVNWPEPVFEHLTLVDGLPESTIICILQDHLGYMWFGTQNGLVRYDGYNMKVYQPDPNDSLSISDRTVIKIYEDRFNNLWIGTYEGGLNRFDRAKETFTSYMHNPDDSSSINSNLVNTICEDNNGNILVGTNAGLNLFNKQTKNFRHLYYQDSVSIFEVKALIKDRLTGKLYVGCSNKILIVGENKKFLEETDNITGMNSDLGIITSFYQAVDGTIWISHSKGLARFNSLLNTIKVYHPRSLINDIVKKNPARQPGHWGQLTEDNDGSIWIVGTWINNYIGMVFFDPKKEQFNGYEPEFEYESDPSYTPVHSVFKDRSGIIWAGTWGYGLKKTDIKKHKFKRYKPKTANSKEEQFGISPVAEDSEGIIWCSTLDGLYSYNRFSNTFRNYKYDLTNNDNYVSHICIDSSGIIWVGTFSGLRKFDRTHSTFQLYSFDTNDSTSLGSNMVSFILPEGNNIIWVGTYNGLNRFDKTTGKFIRYTLDSKDLQSLSSNVIWVLFKDRAQTLWVGTQTGGFNKFDSTTGTFKSFEFADGVGETGIPQIYEDKKGNFWIGTFKDGLHLFDRNNESFVYKITEKDGLTNNHVEAISEDDEGNLWISTRHGLSRFDPETRGIKNYFTSDSFEGNSYWHDVLKLTTGEMLFGTSDGFIMFHPDSIKDDPTPPQVVISNVSLFNRPGEKLTFDGFISGLDELELSYDQNDLRIDYVGLHFGEPDKNQYKYMLENFDDDWIDAGTQRNATYTNLDAGEYIFRVTASNSDGVWNEEGASLKIIIPPPFWASWWAYSFYVLFVLSLLYSIRRYELNRSHLKNQVKLDEVILREREQTDKMKSRFFANISHEFRTPLTLIFGPAKDVLEKTKEPDTKQSVGIIKRNASRLYELVNQLLDLSKLESGKMTLEAREQNIIPLLKGLVLSFMSLAERKNITLRFNTKEENLNVYIDNDKMEKIVNNLLSNAFKFTPEGGNIDFTVEKQVKGVKIKISDSGIGISKDRLDKIFDRFFQVDGSQTREHEGTGIGLALTKELVELHKGKIKVESKEGKGTMVTVLLPLGKGHLKAEEIVKKEMPKETGITIEDTKLIPEMEYRKEKTDIDLLIDTEKPLLLIVEDNPDVRNYIISHLEGDYRIQEAADGEDGLKQALNHIPDLIISDVMMPKMDGFELCNKLKLDEKTSHIPVIMLTAKAASEDKIEGYETGADDYIMKPFDAAELKVRIKNLIAIRKKLQEKFSADDFVIPKELSSIDERFLNKVLKVINEHISEANFSIELLSKESAMSKEQIYKKLKALTGKSPSLFLRSIRLVRAKKMIKEYKGTISEISYLVGFSSPAYFTKCFKEEFGNSPSDLLS